MKRLKLFFYTLLDWISFGKGIRRDINGITIYFPARWSRYFEYDYEKENVAFLKEHCSHGMTVLDIGAHLGLISILCSKFLGPTGKVYAFEPTPSTFEVLNKMILLNKVDTIVHPLQEAISKDKGFLDFFLIETEGSNSNSLVAKNHRSRNSIKIKTNSIDHFVLENKIVKIDIIKIDAEGTELDVLEGAKHTLAELRPKIILAVHPSLISNHNQNMESIFDLIITHKYRVTHHKKLMNKQEFCAMSVFFDVHLIPEEII